MDEASLPNNVRYIDAPQFDVSSTFIREALKEGKDVRYFLHPSTWSKISSPLVTKKGTVSSPKGNS
jgi:nicotinate-nucleotide adenylyltransferase